MRRAVGPELRHHRFEVTFDEETLTGFGKRTYNWEVSAGVQHEFLPTVSADVTYFRRWCGNHVVTDDLAVGPEDFDRADINGAAESGTPRRRGASTDSTTSSRRNSACRRIR